MKHMATSTHTIRFPARVCVCVGGDCFMSHPSVDDAAVDSPSFLQRYRVNLEEFYFLF